MVRVLGELLEVVKERAPMVRVEVEVEAEAEGVIALVQKPGGLLLAVAMVEVTDMVVVGAVALMEARKVLVVVANGDAICRMSRTCS